MSDDDDLEAELDRFAARDAEGRTGKAESPFATDTPEREVPCLECHAPVTLSGFAWDFAKLASDHLLSKGNQALRNDEMTRCQPCAKVWRRKRAELYATLCDKVNAAQHEASANGRVDQVLVQHLRAYGYRDWADGIESGAAKFREKLQKGSKAPRAAK